MRSFKFLLTFSIFSKINLEQNIKRNSYDNGNEYLNQEFSNFFSHNGIVHGLTCVNTPQCRKEELPYSRGG